MRSTKGRRQEKYEATYGEPFPELRGQARDYVEGASMQAPNADHSIEAFVRWRDARDASAATAVLPYLLPDANPAA